MILLVRVTVSHQSWVEAMSFQTLPEPSWVDSKGRELRLISTRPLSSKLSPVPNYRVGEITHQ